MSSSSWSESSARFSFPVSRAILPHLVPAEHFSNAVAWNASTFQIATIAGPALGGLAYAFFRGPAAVYLGAVIVSMVSVIMTFRIHPLDASPTVSRNRMKNDRMKEDRVKDAE